MSTKRAVFITGGSHGLGLFTARSLVAQGAAVALFARDKHRLDQARTDLLEDEPQAEIETFSGDVCHFESLEQSVQRFAESQGSLEAVVHAAGQMRAIGPISQVDPTVWRADMETSLIGAGHLIKAASPWLEKSPQGGSVVVFVGSGHNQGLGFGSGYSAAQAGLVRLMENLALERVWPKLAGQGPEGFVGYYALFPAVTPTGVMDYILRESEGRKWLPRFTEMFGEGKEVEPHVPAAMAAWLCLKKPVELSGRVVSGMLDPELTEMRLGILGEGEKGQLRLKF
jgi:NAD(P)-dependent dehydrogenase (short-subunit alcohol dehydrogenase family)